MATKTLEKPMPCPWCGKTPVVRPYNPEVEGDAWGQVECTNQKCVAQPSVGDGATINDNRGSDQYKAAAIRRWNKRRP